MDLTRNDISPKTENSEDKVLKSKWELMFIRIYVLCTLLQRLLCYFVTKFSMGKNLFLWIWHPEFDPPFFMYPFIKKATTTQLLQSYIIC